MKYAEYRIVEASNIKELEIIVKTAIESKWEPIGGMTVEVFQGFPPKYFQTLAKK